MVWGQRWVIVLLPILSLIATTGKVSISSTLSVYSTFCVVLKIIQIYHAYVNNYMGTYSILYISFVLATTLWCTLLIIYRILTVTGVKHGARGQLRVYHHFIEVLVESSALYSISLVVYLALNIRSNVGLLDLSFISAVAKVCS